MSSAVRNLEWCTPSEQYAEKIPEPTSADIQKQIDADEEQFAQHCAQQLSLGYWDEILSETKNITYERDNQTIRYISVNRCIEHCLGFNHGHQRAFLYTYRTYISPEVLLDKMMQCYFTPQDTNVIQTKIRCINLFASWLTHVCLFFLANK
jgi:hypothetical protein